MASGRARSTRKLRQWTVEQVESGRFPGLVWDDPPAKTMFRIPWKHAGKQDFRHDEDAAFFKAWAAYKGKYRPGERLDPAGWKTRLRCALNKSPEFEEVPARSQLDVAEPYKVYRLVPPAEQRPAKLPARRVPRQVKKEHPESSSEGDEVGSTRGAAQAPLSLDIVSMVSVGVGGAGRYLRGLGGSGMCLQEAGPPSHSLPPQEVMSGSEPVAGASHSSDDSGIDTSERSPDAGVPSPDLNEIVINVTLDSGAILPPMDDYSVLLSLWYSGELVWQQRLPQGDFLVTPTPAPTPHAPSFMQRVLLPPAEGVRDPPKRQATQELLGALAKGVMVASSPQGLFIGRRCRGRVYWRGSGAPPAAPSKLERDDVKQVFSGAAFRQALQLYRQGLGAQPEPHVTLCLGEELGQQDGPADKLIIIQMEQAFARKLLDMPEVEMASVCLLSLESSCLYSPM
ncbi:interferon regulatory factor 9 isoform X1 [Chelonia mydas]|uniref:interferon regulatory factor 9 isoform X1 n=1 Tax=Chelonia mydas TaxID=8469 RepID=UPI001CA9B0E4|nr:interferon regulatory factor 9 isoform X1 [Chelonia mydas]